MTRTGRLMIMLALLPLAACHRRPGQVVIGPPSLSGADQLFIITAAATDAGALQAAQLAQSKAGNPRIKAFAARMIADHRAADEKLNALSQAKNVTVAATPADRDLATLRKLQADSVAAFDRDYIEAQIATHIDAVTAYQTEIDGGRDTDVKAYAAAMLPVIKQHLEMAQLLTGRAHRLGG